MAEDKGVREKASKLVALLRELQAKQYEVTEEISRVLGGEAAMGDKLKQIEVIFDAAWCARYAPGTTKRYIWTYARDRVHMKRLVKSLTLDQIEARILNYIKNDDRFFVQNRHTFGLFVSSVNQHAPETESFMLDAPVVRDCKHKPPCGTDTEHTTRRMEDLRGHQ